MAYSDDIDALGPAHAWGLDGVTTERIAGATGTNVGGSLTATGICEDVTNALETDNKNDYFLMPDSNFINLVAQDRWALSGWFMPTAIQNPPKRIIGVGLSTTMQIILGWGNSLMFETAATWSPLQVFGDVDLEANRAYHLCMVLEGNGYGNVFRCYLDGVRQTNTEPSPAQPNAASIGTMGTGLRIGNVDADQKQVGGVDITVLAPINGRYNEWNVFSGANAVLTDTEIREELFEKGALPDVTITNQSGLDALADTVRPNEPLCIRVDVAGSIDLTADNVTFNPLASIHVQYTGTGTCNWTNSNGSNASIGSTPNGGTLNFLNPSQLTLTSLQNPTEIRVYEAGTQTEIAGQESVTTGTFSATVSAAFVDIQIVSLDYKITRFDNLDMSSDVSIDVVQFLDRTYENP